MNDDHRPWPVPSGPWRMKQTWRHLLFAHWPVPAEQLRPYIPEPIPLDLYGGTAWVGVVPFTMTGIRLRGLPPVPFASAFPELNVRTYVTMEDKPGVYFFSLDAAHALAVRVARTFYHLPYHDADISLGFTHGEITYRSRRRRGRGEGFQFEGDYRPVSPPYRALPGTLDHWLTERYCFYTSHGGPVYRCNIAHDPWPLQKAEAALRVNTMAPFEGVQLAHREPLLHYAERLDVRTWGLEIVHF